MSYIDDEMPCPLTGKFMKVIFPDCRYYVDRKTVKGGTVNVLHIEIEKSILEIFLYFKCDIYVTLKYNFVGKVSDVYRKFYDSLLSDVKFLYESCDMSEESILSDMGIAITPPAQVAEFFLANPYGIRVNKYVTKCPVCRTRVVIGKFTLKAVPVCTQVTKDISEISKIYSIRHNFAEELVPYYADKATRFCDALEQFTHPNIFKEALKSETLPLDHKFVCSQSCSSNFNYYDDDIDDDEF